MSGIEIVGLVLAVAPLIISGLEHYQKGLSQVQIFKKHNKYLHELIAQLRQREVDFNQNVILLLKSAGLEPARLEVYDQTLWKKNGEIENAIEEQLGVACEEYKITVKTYFSHLESIVSRLKYLPGADSTDPGWSLQQKYETILRYNPSTNRKISFSHRLKFTMKHKEIKELIGKLDISNQTLERFQVKADHIQQYGPERSKRLSNKFFQNLRTAQTQACGLYNSFSQALNPICHPNHDISLQLEPRLPERSLKTRNNSFIVLLASERTHKAEISISLLHDSDAKASDEPLNHSPHTTVCGRTPRFVLPSNLQKYDKVDNLCDTIRKATNQQIGIQFHLDPQHTLVCARNTSFSSPICFDGEFVTLETLLCNRQLALRTRMKLALVLSSALLQLCNTPWLDAKSWTKRSIHFRAQQEASARLLRNDAHQQPFITQRIVGSSGLERSCEERPVEARWTLVELGILLVELFLNVTLEEHYRDDPAIHMTQDPYIRQALALKWIENAKEDIFPETIWLAARRCILCQFGNEIAHPLLWANEDLQRAVCVSVVATLSEDLQRV